MQSEIILKELEKFKNTLPQDYIAYLKLSYKLKNKGGLKINIKLSSIYLQNIIQNTFDIYTFAEYVHNKIVTIFDLNRNVIYYLGTEYFQIGQDVSDEDIVVIHLPTGRIGYVNMFFLDKEFDDKNVVYIAEDFISLLHKLLEVNSNYSDMVKNQLGSWEYIENLSEIYDELVAQGFK